nr:Chain C, LPEP peptide from EBV, P6A, LPEPLAQGQLTAY [synthetic construct]
LPEPLAQGQLTAY